VCGGSDMVSDEEIGSGNILNLFCKFVFPAVVGVVIAGIQGIIGGFFIGNAVGSQGLAGMTLAYPPFVVIIGVGVLIGIGSSSLTALELGKGNINGALEIVHNVLPLCFLAGAVLTAGGYVFCETSLGLLEASGPALTFAREYLRIICMGSVFIVLLLYWSGLWSMNGNLVGSAALKIAGTKVGLTFVQGLVRGILCNWLVCLAVWMATASKDIIGKLFAVFFPVMAFVASGFEHSVANMFFIPYGILLKSVPLVVAATGKTLADFAGLNWVTLWTKNLIPVTIGNIIGGAFFVGFIYWFAYLKKAPGSVETK